MKKRIKLIFCGKNDVQISGWNDAQVSRWNDVQISDWIDAQISGFPVVKKNPSP